MLRLCLESPEHSTPLYGQRASTSRRSPFVLAASGRFIFPIIWPNWQVVHRRVATGETLNAAEQAVYESGCQALDTEERLDGNLECLRELRAHIAAAETEQQRLRAQEAELDARIVALEARLDTRTRQLLGISN